MSRAGGAARPGGPGDEDGVIRRCLPPLPGETVDKTGLPRLGGHGRVLAEERLHHAQHRLASRPVTGLRAHVEAGDGLRRDAFLEHLAHQVGEAVGKGIDRGARRKLRVPVDQAAHQIGQLQPQPQRRHRGVEPGKIGQVRHPRDGPQARQEPRAARR
jgi:hypothetical protein